MDVPPQAKYEHNDPPGGYRLKLFFNPVERKRLLYRCIVTSTILHNTKGVLQLDSPALVGIPKTAEVVDTLAQCDEALDQEAVKPGPDTEYQELLDFLSKLKSF